MNLEAPKFSFIRTLCPDLSEEELRAADAAFLAYVLFVVSICERAACDSD